MWRGLKMKIPRFLYAGYYSIYSRAYKLRWDVRECYYQNVFRIYSMMLQFSVAFILSRIKRVIGFSHDVVTWDVGRDVLTAYC